jgi:hypothetical protein
VADQFVIKRAKAERIWRADMMQLGADTIRARFAARLPVTDRPPYPDFDFVQRWLAQQDRKAKMRVGFLTFDRHDDCRIDRRLANR